MTDSSQTERPAAARAIETPKDPDFVRDATSTRSAHRNGRAGETRAAEARQRIARLSLREREVLDLLAERRSIKAIARDLDISPHTVEIHRMEMMGKLGARHAADAVRLRIEATLPWWAELEDRISNLREIAAEEALSFEEQSAKAAMDFLTWLPRVRRPGAFLVNGNIRLVWDKPDGQQVGLQFRDANKIQFVIFQADGDDLGSLMGVKSRDAVHSLVTTSDVFALIADA